MAKLETYRQYIQELLTKYAFKPAYGDVEVETIFDTQRDHYQILNVGWDKKTVSTVVPCTWILKVKKFGFSLMPQKWILLRN